MAEFRRAAWTSLSDKELIGQCAVDTYRASGPGGQKRNKTSSAVRLRHLPTGLLVIAEESRSQHENKERALGRLRKALFLEIRDLVAEGSATGKPEEILATLDGVGRLRVGRKDSRFWPAVGVVLDYAEAMKARVSDVAAALGITTGNLVTFLASDPKVWEQVNRLRQKHGRPPLRA